MCWCRQTLRDHADDEETLLDMANGSYHTWTTEQEADLEAELLSLAARYGCTPHSVASRMKTVAGRLAEEVRNG